MLLQGLCNSLPPVDSSLRQWRTLSTPPSPPLRTKGFHRNNEAIPCYVGRFLSVFHSVILDAAATFSSIRLQYKGCLHCNGLLLLHRCYCSQTTLIWEFCTILFATSFSRYHKKFSLRASLEKGVGVTQYRNSGLHSVFEGILHFEK